MDDFDFAIDGNFENQLEADEESYAEEQEHTADDEIGYEEETGHEEQNPDDHHSDNVEPAASESIQDTEQIGASNGEDEIGYEDEDPDTTGQAEGDNLTEHQAAEASHSPGTSLTQEFIQQDSLLLENEEVNEPDEAGLRTAQYSGSANTEGRGGLPISEDSTSRNHYEDEDEELGNLQHDADYAVDESSAEVREVTEEDVDEEGFNASETAQKSLSNPASDLPDVAVVYNRAHYSLFGSQNDDPETFFLSDAEELDRPSSHFLSSIREVIVDDISAKDRLSVRIDQLSGLEFSDSSDAAFLGRHFREIIECYNKLLANDGLAPETLLIRLLVHQDSEEVFSDLVAGASAGKGSIRPPGGLRRRHLPS